MISRGSERGACLSFRKLVMSLGVLAHELDRHRLRASGFLGNSLCPFGGDEEGDQEGTVTSLLPVTWNEVVLRQVGKYDADEREGEWCHES